MFMKNILPKALLMLFMNGSSQYIHSNMNNEDNNVPGWANRLLVNNQEKTSVFNGNISIEHKQIPSSGIKVIEFQCDNSKIMINPSGNNTDYIDIKFKKISQMGDISFQTIDDRLIINSCNKPNGGCEVHYDIHAPIRTTIDVNAGKVNLTLTSMGMVNVNAGIMKLSCNDVFGDFSLNCGIAKLQMCYSALPTADHAVCSINVNSSICKGTLTFPRRAVLHLKTDGFIKYNNSSFGNNPIEKSNFVVNLKSALGKLNIESQ